MITSCHRIDTSPTKNRSCTVMSYPPSGTVPTKHDAYEGISKKATVKFRRKRTFLPGVRNCLARARPRSIPPERFRLPITAGKPLIFVVGSELLSVGSLSNHDSIFSNTLPVKLSVPCSAERTW